METDTEKFISTFVESGDYLHSMREAGYTEKNVYKLKLMVKSYWHSIRGM